MTKGLRINFVLPPVANISGGPLAILEYANRFAARGHRVSVTTYPNSIWPGDNPFPWFNLNADIHFIRDRAEPNIGERYLPPTDFRYPSQVGSQIDTLHGLPGMIAAARSSIFTSSQKTATDFLLGESLLWPRLIEAMPDCDINIATLWSTAFPVYLSRKGKPTYFMQHYEEIFYPPEPENIIHRLLARASYNLPVYKIANSSWLRNEILTRHKQNVPFSNNGIELADFNPREKKSDSDGVIRVITFSRPEQWKGFADAVAAMQKVRDLVGERVEWHVFGYRHNKLAEDNPYAPYTYHPKLSFSALADLYATCDMALCPSWYESFPLPPLEAMASGTATITTREGTEDYAFHETNALVVGSRDVAGMASAVLRLMEDPLLRQRLANEGRRTAEGFNWEEAVEARERILLAIHGEEPAYDIQRSVKFGAVDVDGIELERAPEGTTATVSGLYWDGPALFLLHGGARHHVVRAELIPELISRGAIYVDVDPLDLERTPIGPPLFTPADLPISIG